MYSSIVKIIPPARGVLSLLLLFLITGGITVLASDIPWTTDVDKAWDRAESEHRPIVIFITKSNCPYCVKMKKETFTDSAVKGTISQGYIPLIIEAERDPSFVKALGIRSFPTLLIISPEEKLLSRLKGYESADLFQKRLVDNLGNYQAKRKAPSLLR